MAYCEEILKFDRSFMTLQTYCFVSRGVIFSVLVLRYFCHDVGQCVHYLNDTALVRLFSEW